MKLSEVLITVIHFGPFLSLELTLESHSEWSMAIFPVYRAWKKLWHQLIGRLFAGDPGLFSPSTARTGSQGNFLSLPDCSCLELQLRQNYFSVVCVGQHNRKVTFQFPLRLTTKAWVPLEKISQLLWFRFVVKIFAFSKKMFCDWTSFGLASICTLYIRDKLTLDGHKTHKTLTHCGSFQQLLV